MRPFDHLPQMGVAGAPGAPKEHGRRRHTQLIIANNPKVDSFP